MYHTPLFSIVIPSYNCAQYIRQTLRSIYCQTEKDYEIIVVNDGSPDDLLEVLALETDPRLRIITQPNGGVSRARNRGIQEAKGRYIAFLDSDDVWLPFHLEAVRVFFEKYPQYHWFATNAVHANKIEDRDFFDKETPTNYEYYESNWFLEFGPLPLASSIVLKREYAGKYLHFPEDIKMFEDNVAWSRFAFQAGPIGTSNLTTALYRQRSDSATRTYLKIRNLTVDLFERIDLRMQQEMLKEFPESREALLYFRKRVLYNWIEGMEKIQIKQWMTLIDEKRSIVGECAAFLLSLYAKITHFSSKLTKKILLKILNKTQKDIEDLMIRKRKKLLGTNFDADES